MVPCIAKFEAELVQKQLETANTTTTTSTQPYYSNSSSQIPFQATTVNTSPISLDSGTDNSPVSTPLQDTQSETQQPIFTSIEEYTFDNNINFDGNTQMSDVSYSTLFSTLIGEHNNLQIMESTFNDIDINNTDLNTSTSPLDFPYTTSEQ